MPRIAISYRREDSGVITGRIFDRLVSHFGRDSVFRDIDDIPLGVDFRSHIGKTLAQSDIVLAIIGPQWVGSHTAGNRLGNESDPVRLEIEAALREGVPLIPVLVLGGAMPPPSDMPDSIRDFVYRNAIQIDAGQDFDDHMARLFRALGRLLEQPAAGTRDIVGHERGEVLPPRSLKRRSKFQFSIALKIAVPVLLAVITSIWYIVIRPEFDRSHQSIPTVAAPSMPAADLVEREQQAYAAAHGNLSALKSYVNGCTVCSFRAAARDEISKLETTQQEEQTYNAARGNLSALNSYVNGCTVCSFKTAARDEISKLETTQQEEQTYNAARGNLSALKSYVNGCTVCSFKTAARDEISKLETTQQEEQTYNAARGNLSALNSYVNGCTVCSFKTAARDEISKLETTQQEEQTYNGARGNPSALKSYVNGCTVCSFRAAARDEINKLETMEQEDRMYYTSRGNKYALQAYLNVCTVCEHQSAARAEIAALEAAQPKRVSSSAMICGRSVDYVVEDTGIADAYRSFLGVWTGAAWNSRICGGLIVLSADNGGIARVIYIYGPLPGTQFSWKQQTQNAQILNGQLTFRDEEGGNFTFRLREQRVLNGHFVNTSGAALDAVLTRDMASVPQ